VHGDEASTLAAGADVARRPEACATRVQIIAYQWWGCLQPAKFGTELQAYLVHQFHKRPVIALPGEFEDGRGILDEPSLPNPQ
jgi:hypothetical protein